MITSEQLDQAILNMDIRELDKKNDEYFQSR